jgi:class 3 adenylate cyclase
VAADWTLVWVSRELEILLGSEDPTALGIGSHLAQAQLRDIWRSAITEATELEQFQRQLPMMIADTPGGREALKQMLPDVAHSWLEGMSPADVPALWTSAIEFVQGDLPPVRVRVVDIRLGTERERLGVLRVYGSDLPAHVLALVGRGEERLFERMARIFSPAQREAAILFADLEASGALARQMGDAAYFELIRELTTRVDELVIDRGGIVGKHAGDGVTAFFVSDDFSSPSEAASAAIRTAMSIRGVAAELGSERSAGPDAQPLTVNVGLHWGERLFMGQVVTGGRIEVTALGDEVNEAARLEQSATQGAVLTSENLLDQLTDDDAAALGMRLSDLSYGSLSDREGLSEKALRDAGGIVVTDIGASLL